VIVALATITRPLSSLDLVSDVEVLPVFGQRHVDPSNTTFARYDQFDVKKHKQSISQSLPWKQYPICQFGG
jgi:hypothetical protein